MSHLASFVQSAEIGPEVHTLRPDCAVLVVAVDQVICGPSDDISRSWLSEASEVASTVDHSSHLDAWRDAYRSFGIKPQKFRPSFDALIRRSSTSLPEVNRVVDAYNAISVKYGLPIGGENIDAYQGPLRLVRAEGREVFDTVSNGTTVMEAADPGEVVWRDDLGVTCRRWNWRQGVRTRVHPDTNRVFFLFERLEPFPIERLHEASEELLSRVAGPRSSVETRLIQLR